MPEQKTLRIYKEGGFWVAHLEKLFAEPEAYPMAPDNKSLYLLVKALESAYPEYRLSIDHRISENPFVSKHLLTSNHYRLLPDYIRIQYALDNPEVKKCGLCGGPSWYNSYGDYYPEIGWWECTLVKCHAREFNGKWQKLARSAR